jgi:hypothetical protein
MVEIARRDAPWVWSFFPKDYALQHAWVHNRKPHSIANNGLKYQRIDPVLRARLRGEWNRPVAWPAAALILIAGIFVVPAFSTWRKKERQAAGTDQR